MVITSWISLNETQEKKCAQKQKVPVNGDKDDEDAVKFSAKRQLLLEQYTDQHNVLKILSTKLYKCCRFSYKSAKTRSL